MQITAEPAAPVPLTAAVFHILLALAEGEMHGYAIMQEVSALTGGSLRMGPGTLYGSIKRLLASGWVEEVGGRDDGEDADGRRRYYRLTEAGDGVLRAEARRLEAIVGAARRRHLLSPRGVG